MAGVGRHLGRRGIEGRGGTTVFHSGGTAPPTTTTGTDLAVVATEAYFCEVYLPQNALLTGIAVLNGSAVAGNLQLALYDSTGVAVATTASTLQSGTAAYQKIPFSTPYQAIAPGKFYICVQGNNTSARLRTHILGVFTAGKQTGGTFGTFAAFTDPGTFTTGLGVIASTY